MRQYVLNHLNLFIDHNTTNASSILLQNQNKVIQTHSTPDVNTLVKSVMTDMTAAEKGGQWLLSSYAPFKEKTPFPGFEDHSMEEIRYQFYESIKNGTNDQFKHNLQCLLQQAVLKIKALQNPSADVVNMLKTIYNTLSPNSVSSQHQQTIFSGAQSGGFNNANSSIFSGSTQNTSFLPAANLSQSIFATSQQQPPLPNPSIFATPQQTPLSNPPSIFNNFGTPAPNYSVFSGNQSSSFNQPVIQTSNQPLIASTASEPIQNSGVMQHSANIFGNLGAQNTGNFVAQQSGNIFDKPVPQTSPNPDFYSKMEDLTEDEIKWFQSDSLDVKSIPEKPPPYEFCFNVKHQ